MTRILLSLSFILLLVACKQKSQPVAETALAKAKVQLEENPDKENALHYLSLLREEMHKDLNHPRVEGYLREGIEVADNHNLQTYKIGYITSLMQAYPEIDDRKNYLGMLAETFGKAGNSLPGNILIEGYIDNYPTGEKAAMLKELQGKSIEDPIYLLDSIATEIFKGSDGRNINKSAARAFVDGTEATILAYPDHEAAGDYLFKAAEIARSNGSYEKAMELYDWIYRGYKNSGFGSKALISQALMLESDLQDIEGAKEKYDMYLEAYPDDELADQVKILRENVGLTDEQLMQKLKSNQK